jgi:hypothetical protein
MTAVPVSTRAANTGVHRQGGLQAADRAPRVPSRARRHGLAPRHEHASAAGRNHRSEAKPGQASQQSIPVSDRSLHGRPRVGCKMRVSARH